MDSTHGVMWWSTCSIYRDQSFLGRLERRKGEPDVSYGLRRFTFSERNDNTSPHRHLGARQRSGSRCSSLLSLGMVVGSPPRMRGLLGLRSRTPRPVLWVLSDIDLAVWVGHPYGRGLNTRVYSSPRELVKWQMVGPPTWASRLLGSAFF